MKYDSAEDTWRHIDRVNELMLTVISKLLERGINHDASKLDPLEKDGFDKWSYALKSCEFGSDDYNKSLAGLKDTIEAHYATNTHHPEHYENGIDDFCLFDLVELFVDWKASSERSPNGDMSKSIDICAKRFKMSDQLVSIFRNTLERHKDELSMGEVIQ